MAFLKTKKDLFFTKNDTEDPRLGDLVSTEKNFKDVYVIGGYPDDEGIRANGGRPGAKDAPAVIRKYFYKMTPHLLSRKTPKIYDYGDLEIEGNLDGRQAGAIDEVQGALKAGGRWIGVGGGHDWGYVDGSAFLNTFTDKPLVINFDAHMDVRPDTKGTNSGSPFFKLANKYKNFDFFEIGLQSQCNSKAHLEWLKQKGGQPLFYDELMLSSQPPAEKILNFLESAIRKHRPTYLSVDIDAFSSSWAPGCSQSFATGLNPEDFFKVLEVLKERLDVRCLGIYEVSPPLDEDDKTSKLAALIMHRFIF